ncbi:MAG: transglutaminase domain-containing protein, partial [Chloroflexi bacterium]|nr:transglutaminase domain-containing protein [Chloroflexota bacterium]
MAVTFATSLAAAQWASGLAQIAPVAVMAVIAGTLVARSGFSARFALVYSLSVGAAAVLSSISLLAPNTLPAQQRVYYILERTGNWMYRAMIQQPVADQLVFVLFMAALTWVLAFSAAWSYFRNGRKWQTVLPVGVALLINLYYAPAHLRFYFAIYLLAAILLLVRATLTEREIEWRSERVYFPMDIGFDFMRDGIIFALFIITVAWILPDATGGNRLKTILQPLEEPWQNFQKEWSDLFNTAAYGRVEVQPVFGTSLALSGPRTVTDAPVMDVKTPVNRYFRATVLDTYTSSGWFLQEATGLDLTEVEKVQTPKFKARRGVIQEYTTFIETNVLIAAPQPESVDMPADARVLLPPIEEAGAAGAGEQRVGELAMLIAHETLRKGDSYQAVSYITIASVEELRADHTNYPDYIKERYLALPDTIPQRVFDVTEKLTQGLDNPYDIAKQLETYLRGYEYNESIPGPKPGQDAVDYFLFEERAGYCNYYASSLAVMLRYLGIPTRLAVGYATGEPIPETGAYRLREKDLHTWVEVFFPTYGWIEFEPTASEPVLARPSSAVETQDDPTELGQNLSENKDPEEDAGIEPEPEQGGGAMGSALSAPAEFIGQRWGYLLLMVSILGVLLLAIWSARRMTQPPKPGKKPVFRTVPAGFAVRLWEKLVTWARRLGLTDAPSLTPLERAHMMAELAPEAAADIQAITQLYIRDQYSPHPITVDDASEAHMRWLTLRPLLIRRWLDMRLRMPKGLRRALFW